MNNKTISEKLTFRKLISKHKIEIPIIQRDYAQGRTDKEEIRSNFLKALLEAAKNDKNLELDFIYGSVKNDILQPLDGQQRLTTLFLLHWYIAIKENRLDDKVKELLAKFTYETRSSSREFCSDLIYKGIDIKGIDMNNEQKLSELIIDSPWFFLSWKKDPTIKAMLIMLDAIHDEFHDKDNVWDKLENISFHYIELQHFGLSDDLYIKMNARGKPLTNFENFKAKFEQLITKNEWEKNIEPDETFSYKIDTSWTDLFWYYRDEKNVFDQQFMNFFKTLAQINDALIGKGGSTLEFNNLSESCFRTLKAILNKISDKTGVKKFLNNTTYVNEEELFKGAIENSLGYADMVKLFALYQYLALEENIEEEKLTNWMRVIRNLVEGSRPYLFNNVKEFSDALCSVNELLPQRNTIDECLSKTKEDSLPGFIKIQVAEEKLKSRLILENNEWKNPIIETENHGYFNGQIGFLLDWSKNENDEVNIKEFKKYTDKAKAIFSDNGLEKFENHLFERAMLATGNYLLTKGRNYSFLINNERDISWKRLLRDMNENRGILKKLIDKLSISSLDDSLKKIVDDFSCKDDWRYYFIKQPEMIDGCGRLKLIRKYSAFDILLLDSTTTSGFHKEYYSYSLYIQLKKDKIISEQEQYKPQRSINYRKYFTNGSQIIFFNGKEEKYIIELEDGNKEEFENREGLIESLKEKINN